MGPDDIEIGNGAARLLRGDCMERLRELPDNSVDAIVTDPPYELGFMGKGWDSTGVAFRPELWAEAMRVLKPGGHLLAFSGSRTYHRMAVAIEDGGFEIRDQIMWVYGSGFPKSMDVAKQLEKMPIEDSPDWVECWDDREKWLDQYRGMGTALKPAHEPICMARKPLDKGKTVAANVLQHGTGALNIDGCRVSGESTRRTNSAEMGYHGGNLASEYQTGSDSGRFPANLIHDGSEEVVALFPNSAGAGGSVPNVKVTGYGSGIGTGSSDYLGGERTKVDSGSGSAARFFYCAKANRKDRNEGLTSSDTPAVRTEATMREREDADWSKRNGNHHPTVKPTDLMAYLCRLVTPPSGTVLDPFMGSGSTGKAAIREGFRFIGCELSPEYLSIAAARIEHAWQQAYPEPSEAAPETCQLALFA